MSEWLGSTLLNEEETMNNPEDFIAETCPEALLQDTCKALRADVDALRGQRDALRRALEIIAVGDAQNPQIQAAEELIALGYWSDIPEARIPVVAAPAVG